jgi:pimeloyl-ACP methyl ester carboxylesterase
LHDFIQLFLIWKGWLRIRYVKCHGNKPIEIVTVHGGPGAPGSVKELAILLSQHKGVLEPYQTKLTVNELVLELNQQIENYCKKPVILIGHSSGALLSLLYTDKYPKKVKKLILISSAPLDEKWSEGIMKKRLERLAPDELKQLRILQNELVHEDIQDKEKSKTFMKLGEIMSKTDAYNGQAVWCDYVNNEELSDIQYPIYKSIWPEMSTLRKNGYFLNVLPKIEAPISVFHGRYDSHPIEGVINPFQKINKDISCHLFYKCGHYPWLEPLAKNTFFKILFNEVEF